MKRYYLHATLLTVLLLLLGACAGDTEQSDADRLVMRAMVGHTTAGTTATRSTDEGTWAGTETVVVEVRNAESSPYMQNRYRASADGLLTYLSGDMAFTWGTGQTELTARGWYKGDAVPTTVDGQVIALPTDQSAGIAAGDFLYAPPQTLRQPESPCPFYFWHQPALLRIGITCDRPISRLGDIISVTIGDDTHWISAAPFTAPAGGVTRYGAWDCTSGFCQTGAVGPYDDPVVPDGAQKQYVAMVVPQPVQGKRLITITLQKAGEAPQTYHYDEDSGIGTYLPGMVYTYRLWLKNEMLVNVTTADWQLSDGDKPMNVEATLWDQSAVDPMTRTNPDWWTLGSILSGTIVTSNVHWIEVTAGQSDNAYGALVSPWELCTDPND